MDRSKRNPRKTRRNNSEAKIMQRVHELARGKAFRPPPYPALLGLQPWNQAVIRLLTSDGLLMIGKVIETAIKQMGLYSGTTTCPMEMRILSFSAWELTGKIGTIMRIYPMDFARKEAELVSVDAMSTHLPASCGYVFPASLQNLTLSSMTDKTVLMSIDVPPEVPVELHISVQWRGSNTSVIQMKPVVIERAQRRTRRLGEASSESSFDGDVLDIAEEIGEIEITSAKSTT